MTDTPTPNTEEEKIRITIMKRCIWCGDGMPEAEWKSIHPMVCPYFSYIVQMHKEGAELKDK